MILLDVNVLVHAHRPSQSDEAARTRRWLDDILASAEPVAVATETLAAMVRLTTDSRIFKQPSLPRDAMAFAQALLDAPTVSVARPSGRHWHVFQALVIDQRLVGNDVPDAYLAALALDIGATLATRDRGFTRFPGLRLVDPLRA